MPKEVVLYHQHGCPPCEWAAEFFRKNAIPFTERDVRADEAALIELAKAGINSTPAIKIDGLWYVGFEPDLLKEALGIR